MANRTCTLPDCERKHEAKGLCKPHYKQQRAAEGYQRPAHPATCETCGEGFERADRKQVYCSPDCREPVRRAKISQHYEVKSQAKCAARREWANIRVWFPHCDYCSLPFLSRHRYRMYCSGLCAKTAQAVRMGCRNRACRDCRIPLGFLSLVSLCGSCRTAGQQKQARKSKAARRARMRSVVVERFDPQEIYERDGWRCGICRKRVDRRLRYPHRRSVSLDHIEPLASGGMHERRNVQCAHLECNMRKHASGPGQLLLVG